MSSVIKLLIVFSIGVVTVTSSYAQTDGVNASRQTTLSGELLNNPLAQDILKKIEQTKQWIAELEKQDYERIQAQKELEEKREIALQRLNEDLQEWETLWANYTSRASFERFVADKPAPVQGVFWDSFEFKEMKVNAGREALKNVIANGGTLQEAREAYLRAAETKRIELIEANAQFNVKHNLAYYQQQLLFDTQGRFVNTAETEEQLGQYYTDYRANPAYLAANPDDKLSYEELSRTNPNTQCREGYVVVHRFHANDYTCVTESTAEMWIQLGMGEIPGVQSYTVGEQPSGFAKTNPLTECGQGYKLVYVVSTSAYSCVAEDTANEWIANGTAQVPDVGKYILDQIEERETRTETYYANERIRQINDEIRLREAELLNHYDRTYKEKEVDSKMAEKSVLEKFHSAGTMTKKELSDELLAVRNHYKDSLENILDEKINSMDELKKELDIKIQQVMQDYKDNPEVRIVWNSGIAAYEVVSSTTPQDDTGEKTKS